MKHKVKHIHFVGIGGSGMSGIAEVLLNLGYQISGSDLTRNAAAQRLQTLGASVFQGHAAEHARGADAVVVSTAVANNNPEVQAARAARIPVVPRALMLAELMRLKQGVAVAGTHGKTTTTSLIASVLAEGGLDPTFVIGGRLTSAGANAKLGAGEFIVVEADESDASFLNLAPVIAVITNIDADHMETYGYDFARLKAAFIEFTQRLPFYGTAVLCADDAHVRSIMPLMSKPIVSYGTGDDAQVRASGIVADKGAMHFDVTREGMAALPVTLNLAGRHNVLNALAAIAVATELGVSDAAIQKSLAGFKGVGRRFQHYGEISIPGAQVNDGRVNDGKLNAARNESSYTLIDDYGHHPAEMAAVIAAARGAYPGRRLVLAFQPHRYTRTRDCFEDFVKVLATADAVVLAEVYAAGEAPIVAADGRALMRALRVAGKVEPVFVEQISALAAAVRQTVRAGDVVITMGAGSIGGVARELAA